MTTVVHILGHQLKPLETIEHVGSMLGLSRATSFRRAQSWPLDGEKGSRRVVVPALAEKLGIPYECVPEEAQS